MATHPHTYIYNIYIAPIVKLLCTGLVRSTCVVGGGGWML